MATNWRQTSGGGRPPRATGVARPVYEQFRPSSELKKQDDQSQLLLVHLPGFAKEQIKVSTEGTNTLRVRGERLVGGNKWSRFQEEFRIPDECNLRGIRAKFEGETLTITMPMTSTLPAQVVGPTREAAKTTATTTTTREEAPRPQETRDEIPPKVTSAVGEAKKTDGKGIIQEESSQKVATQQPKSPKGQGGTIPPLKPISLTTTSDHAEKQPADGKGVGLTTKEIVQETIETTKERSDGKGKPTEVRTPESIASGKNAQKELKGSSDQKGKESLKLQDLIAKTVKEKEEGKGTASVQKGKTDDYSDVAKEKLTTDVSSGGVAAGDGFTLDKYKQAMKGFVAKGGNLNKERQLIVNMGTAILVIVALVAYISYTLGSSSGKTQN